MIADFSECAVRDGVKKLAESASSRGERLSMDWVEGFWEGVGRVMVRTLVSREGFSLTAAIYMAVVCGN